MGRPGRVAAGIEGIAEWVCPAEWLATAPRTGRSVPQIEPDRSQRSAPAPARSVAPSDRDGTQAGQGVVKSARRTPLPPATPPAAASAHATGSAESV